MSRILGIDFGLKRIGLSVSDPTKTLASPLPTILNDKNSIKKICEIINKYEIEKVVIGYPVNMNGSKSEICELVDDFISKILEKINI